jgi:hypothetical protein
MYVCVCIYIHVCIYIYTHEPHATHATQLTHKPHAIILLNLQYFYIYIHHIHNTHTHTHTNYTYTHTYTQERAERLWALIFVTFIVTASVIFETCKEAHILKRTLYIYPKYSLSLY